MSAPSNSANGAMLSSTPPEIEVSTGGFVDLYKPDPATLHLEDIARGMAYTCRYGGQIKRFYSVAEHACLVHDLLLWMGTGVELQRAGLFHDAAEAYLGDVVAPLKWALRRQSIDDDAHYMGGWPPDVTGRRSAYDRLSDRMDDALVERFGLNRASLDCETLRTADMWALRIESRALTTTSGAHWRWPGTLPRDGMKPGPVRWEGGMAPDDARERWLALVRKSDLALAQTPEGG
jgi:hypothetical protein